MANKISLHEESFRMEYYQYKAYAMPIIVLLVSVFIFFQVVIPQTQNWFSLQNDIKTHQKKVSALNQDLGNISGLDETSLNTNLQLTSAALPPQLDYLSIVSVINQAGVNAGVSVSDYSINSQSAEVKNTNKQSLQMSVNILGNIDGVRKFIGEVKKKLPLSDITEVHTAEMNASVSMVFFYKPFPRLQFNDTEPIQPLSANEQGLITVLSSYQKPGTDDGSNPIQ